MDEWFRTSLSFALGAAVPVIVKFGESLVDRRQRATDRQSEYQRICLTDLQDSVVEYVDALGQEVVARGAFHEPEIPFRAGGLDSNSTMIFSRLRTRLVLSKSRVKSEPVRNKADALVESIRLTLRADSKTDCETKWRAVLKLQDEMNDLMGTELQKI